MSIFAEFYDSTATAYVDIAHRLKFFYPEVEVDYSDNRILKYKGLSLEIDIEAGESFNIQNDQFFRVRENTGSGDTFIFTGYIKNKQVSIKTGAIKFDVVSEAEYFKTVDISSISFTGTTYRARLLEGIPAGYTIVEMDAQATAALDGNQPMDTWTYPDGFLSDLLYDILLILTTIENNDCVAIILNKEIRIYANPSSIILQEEKLIEILSGGDIETLAVLTYSEINDNMRKTGSFTPPLSGPVPGFLKKSVVTVLSVEKLNIFDEVSYNSVNYGNITRISSADGVVFEYEAQKLEFVAR